MKNNLMLIVFLFHLLCIDGCKEEPIEQEPAKEQFPKQLTYGDLSDWKAWFSPNGKYIAFYSWRYSVIPDVAWSPYELWTMSRDGFDQKRVVLTTSIHELTIPTLIGWTKDSKSMIVHIQDNYMDYKSEIWQVAVTGERKKLAAPGLRLEKLSYSPDKSKLAYIIQGPNPPMGGPVYKLYVANADFSDSVRIEKGLIGHYEWMPDSKGLIYGFSNPQDKSHDIWKATKNGTEKRNLSHSPEYEEYFSLSHDGKQVAYSISDSIYITSTDNSSPQLLMANARRPYWIPGRDLLMIQKGITDSNNNPQTEIWIIDSQGNSIRKDMIDFYREISFSSDGHYFLYNVDGNLWMNYLP